MKDLRRWLVATPVFFLLLLPCSHAQIRQPSHTTGGNELYAGYSYLSNSFNSNGEFSGGGLNGWDAAAKFRLTDSLGAKIAGIGEYGTSLGDAHHAHFLMGGGQYTRYFGARSIYLHGLVGIGHINAQAITGGGEGPQSDFSFVADAGGGFNAPISRRTAWRFEAAMLHANFTPKSDQIHGTPNYFARISTGIVWRF